VLYFTGLQILIARLKTAMLAVSGQWRRLTEWDMSPSPTSSKSCSWSHDYRLGDYRIYGYVANLLSAYIEVFPNSFLQQYNSFILRITTLNPFCREYSYVGWVDRAHTHVNRSLALNAKPYNTSNTYKYPTALAFYWSIYVAFVVVAFLISYEMR